MGILLNVSSKALGIVAHSCYYFESQASLTKQKLMIKYLSLFFRQTFNILLFHWQHLCTVIFILMLVVEFSSGKCILNFSHLEKVRAKFFFMSA